MVCGGVRLLGRCSWYSSYLVWRYCALALVLLGPCLAPLHVASAASFADLTFNEVLAQSITDWDHDNRPDDPPGDAYVEFYNQGSTPFSMASVLLDVGPGSSSYAFPLTTTIQPGGVLVLFAHQDPYLRFSLAGGELRILAAATGVPVTTLHYPPLKPDQAYSRTAAGDWTTADQPSPGALNPGELPPTPAEIASGGSRASAPSSTPQPSTPIMLARREAPGRWVTVSGQVTAPLGTVSAGHFDVQDAGGGIAITMAGQIPPPLVVGDWVVARGMIGEFQHEPELVVPADGTLQWGGTGMAPSPVAVDPVTAAVHDGQLVRVDGRVLATSRQAFTVGAPGTQVAWCTVRWLDPGHIDQWRVPMAGTSVTLTGILMHNADAGALPWVLWLRSPLDLHGQPATALWGMPVAEARAAVPGTVVTIIAQVSASSSTFDGRALYVADISGGLHVQLTAAGTFWPGIGGWLALSGTMGRVANEPALMLPANVPARVLGVGPPPQPILLATLALLPRYTGQLVRIAGQIGRSPSGAWFLSAHGARVAVGVSPPVAAALAPATQVPITLTGIVSGASSQIVLVPRDAHDIQITDRAHTPSEPGIAQVQTIVRLLVDSWIWWLTLLCACLIVTGLAWWRLPRAGI